MKALILVLMLVVPSLAWGETVPMNAGDQAPSVGMFFDQPTAERMAQDLAELPLLREKVKVLEAQKSALESQVAILEKQVQDSSMVMESVAKVLQESRFTLQEVRLALEAANKTIREQQRWAVFDGLKALVFSVVAFFLGRGL